MSLPAVKDFFTNKVSIKLKNGHKFEGLLSSINYKNQSVILEDVEDLGNETDKNFIPHDKKIVEKGFASQDIEEILFKQKHFCEAKKYNKNDFWDAVSQPVAQQPKYRQKNFNDKGDKPYYKKNYNNDNRGGEYRKREGDNENRGEYRKREGDNENRGEYRKREGGNYNNQNRGGNYRNHNEKEQRNDYRRKEEHPREEEENSRDYR